MNARELTCGRCFASLACNVADPAGCWCASIALNAPVRADLRARFDDCLCAGCLREVAKSAIESTNDSTNEKAGAEKLRPAR